MSLFYKMLDPSSKAAITVTKSEHKTLKAIEMKVPKLMKQSIVLYPFAPCAYRNNFIYKLMDATLSRLIEAGIPQYQFRYLMNFEFKPLIEPPKAPRTFSFSDLEFGFVTWSIACGISIGVFTAEILWFLGSRLVLKFLIRYVILRFLKIQRLN